MTNPTKAFPTEVKIEDEGTPRIERTEAETGAKVIIETPKLGL